MLGNIHRGLLTFLLAVSLVVTPAAMPAGAQDAPSRSGFTVCNYSGEKAAFAYEVQFSPGTWTVQGWRVVKDGECEAVEGLASPVGYYYASSDSGVTWSGTDIKLCTDPAKFEYDNIGSRTCSGKETLSGFTKITAGKDNPKVAALVGHAPNGGKMPLSPTAARSESQLLYDMCARSWNANDWNAKSGPRALVGGSNKLSNGNYSANCFGWMNASLMSVAIANATKACTDAGFAKCYTFAEYGGLVPWAAHEMDAVTSGARNPPPPPPPPQPAPPPPAAAPPPPQVSDNGGGSSDDDDSGPSFGSFLGAALQGLSMGAQIGNALRGGGASVPSYGGSSSNNSSTCAQLLSMANQCKVNQQNMASPGSPGNGTTGQAGAFNDCYNNYMNGYRAEHCS